MNLADFESWAREAILSEKAKGFKLFAEEWGIVYENKDVTCGCLQTVLVLHKGGQQAVARMFNHEGETKPETDHYTVEDKIAAEVLEIDILESVSLRCGFDLYRDRAVDSAWWELGARFREEFKVRVRTSADEHL